MALAGLAAAQLLWDGVHEPAVETEGRVTVLTALDGPGGQRPSAPGTGQGPW